MKLTLYSLVLFLFFHICAFASTPAEFSEHFKLLPQPQKIELLTGKGLLYYELRGVHIQDKGNRPVMTGILSNLPRIGFGAFGSVSLIINVNLGLPSAEGYQLEIMDSKVMVQAMDPAGLFYGIQTLSQLLEDAQDQQIEIPPCRITDYPEIAYRAVHLDLKHHIDAGHYYYAMIDRLAGIKVNAIIIEFEDKLRYRKSPLVASPNAISIEEFAALSKYAKDRHIEISPLIQGLGHASYILKHEKYKSLRDDPVSDWVFDPLNPGTYDLQFSLYEDAIEATPYGKYLHVGGDEVGALGKSALSKASGMKPLELQMYWLKKVTDFARQHNRVPIFWDDMVFKLANLYETTYDSSIPAEEIAARWKKNAPLLEESLPIFPKGCAYMRWNYDDPMLPGNQMAIDWYKANNLTVMAATSAQTYSSMFPNTIAQFQPIKKFCQLTSEKKMSGILCTIWDDTSPHLEVISRGVFDFALFSWNYEDLPMDKAHTLFQHRFYAAALAKPAFNFQDLMEGSTTPFWATAFLQEGDREVYHKTFALITLPDPKNKGDWSKTYKEKLSKANALRMLHTEIAKQLAEALEVTRRNEYALSLFSVINELQTYTCDVLLQLQQYDQASKKKQGIIALQIKKTLEGFPTIRNRFEEAYGKSRIMGNPKGYQLDSNFHHHLANGTNTTDWIFIYEIAMNKKINDWLLQSALAK